MSLSSTQLPPLQGAENRRLAVLRGKRRAFTFGVLLVITATLLSVAVTLKGEPNFPEHLPYWVTNALLLGVSGWALIIMRELENVRLVERVGLVTSFIYLFTWDVVALAARYEPRAEFLMTSAATFLLTGALICLVVRRRYLPYTLAGVLTLHELLTWGNLLQFPWSNVHTAQLTSDLLLVTTTVFLNLIGSFQHLMSTSQQETELVRLLVNTDELTGLANARSLAAQLGALPTCAVLLLEVDDFEGLLIDLGEEVTDDVLLRLARTLRREVGKHGSCGRWGNNQFVVLLPYAGQSAALNMAGTLQRELTALDIGEPFTLSIGVAVASEQINGLDLLHLAARRLSRAQSMGGNTIVAHSAPMPGDAPGDQETTRQLVS